MSENASVSQATQLGPETTAGTAVAATKRLQATSFNSSPDGGIAQFTPAGQKYATLALPGKEWSKVDVDGVGSYTDLVYLFSMAVKAVTPTNPSGAAYLWDFAPSGTLEDVVKTFTAEKGNRSRAGRVKNLFLNDLSLAWDREKVTTKASGMATSWEDDIALSTAATYTLTANGTPPTAGTFTLTYAGQTTAGIAFDATPAAVKAALEALSTIAAGDVDVALTTLGPTLAVASSVYTITFKRALGAQAITLTGTFTGLTASGSIALAAGTVGAAATAVTAVPILGQHLDVWMDDTSGALGTTKLTRAFRGEWSLSGRFNTVWPVNTAQSSFVGTVEKATGSMFKFTHAYDDVGAGLLTTMRAGDSKFIRFKATGPVITGAYTNYVILDMAAKVSKVLTFEDADGVYSVGAEFVLVDDASWGKPFRCQIEAPLSAL